MASRMVNASKIHPIYSNGFFSLKMKISVYASEMNGAERMFGCFKRF